jgi:hypothetical protein
MDMNLFLTLLGIIATLLIGYWGVKLTLKTRRNVSVAFVEREYIPLFKTIIKNFNSLEISYKHKPITENLVLIKVSIVNDGNIDIDKSMVYKPISIKLPSNFTCIEQTITDKSENVNSAITMLNSELIIEWDLLKKDEFISFDLLVETTVEKENDTLLDRKNLNDYKIDQRITNLNAIKKYSIDFTENEKITTSKMIRRKIMPWIFILLGLGFSLLIILKPESRFDITYFTGQKEFKKELKLTPISISELRLKSKVDSLNITIPVTQLKEKYDINFDIERRSTFFYISLIYGILILLTGLMFIIIQRPPEREKTIKKIIKNKA